jgi:hypothetical protein
VPTSSQTPTTTTPRCRQQTLRGRAPYKHNSEAQSLAHHRLHAHTHPRHIMHSLTNNRSALQPCPALQRAQEAAQRRGRGTGCGMSQHTTASTTRRGALHGAAPIRVAAAPCAAAAAARHCASSASRLVLSTLNGQQRPTGHTQVAQSAAAGGLAITTHLTTHQPQPQTVLAAQNPNTPGHGTQHMQHPLRALSEPGGKVGRTPNATRPTLPRQLNPKRPPQTPADASSRRTVAQVVKSVTDAHKPQPAPCSAAR